MTKSKSSRNWLHEHFKDNYVKQAQKKGLRARSAFKLEEIQQKHKILKPGNIVIDLGAAPGSWSQFAADIVGDGGKVFAIDLLKMPNIADVEFIQGDFTDEEIKKELRNKIGSKQVDVVMSDMAPNFSGVAKLDRLKAIMLIEEALDFAKQVLKPNGTFLVKTFQGSGFEEFYKQLKQYFATVKTIKPAASRSRSSEVYILAQKFCRKNSR